MHFLTNYFSSLILFGVCGDIFGVIFLQTFSLRNYFSSLILFLGLSSVWGGYFWGDFFTDVFTA